MTTPRYYPVPGQPTGEDPSRRVVRVDPGELDDGEVPVWDSATRSWVPGTASSGASALFIAKAADETVTNSNVVQDDDHLTLAVVANAIYIMEAFIIYDGSTAGDFKMIWDAPAGATLDWWAPNIATNVTVTAGAVSVAARAIGDSATVGACGAGTKAVVKAQGRLVVGSTAGNFKLRWSQNTADATATTVFAGSWLSLTRLS